MNKCGTCFYEKKSASEYPCSCCKYAHLSKWTPKPKEGAVKDE